MYTLILIIGILGVLMIGGVFAYQIWALRKGRVETSSIVREIEEPLSSINISETSYKIRRSMEQVWHTIVLYTTGSLMWTVRLLEKKLRAIVYRTYDRLHTVRSKTKEAQEVAEVKEKSILKKIRSVKDK